MIAPWTFVLRQMGVQVWALDELGDEGERVCRGKLEALGAYAITVDRSRDLMHRAIVIEGEGTCRVRYWRVAPKEWKHTAYHYLVWPWYQHIWSWQEHRRERVLEEAYQ